MPDRLFADPEYTRIVSRNLADSVVVITGASAGIGYALARELHHQNARLVLAARRLDKLEDLTVELGKAHVCVPCDVSKPDDCERLIRTTIEHFGRIDTMVCNAGFGIGRLSSKTTPAELRSLFDTNLLGTSECVRHAVAQMLKQDRVDGYRGQIMIVSSAAARRGLPMLGMYSATKAAQLVYAESLRVELERTHIAVTTVHPVGTKTEFGDVAREQGQAFDIPGRSLFQQTAEHVAKKMSRAMRYPVRECWPMWPARYLIALNGAFPILGDIVMGRQFQAMQRKLGIKLKE
jgi:short-subunit dehydrogenase